MFGAVEATLRRRRAGIKSRRDCISNARLLTDLEEKVLVERILDLGSKGHPPNLRRVGDMANLILAGRKGRKVGINWPSTFVKRHSELQTRFNRKYDYQRAKNEDPKVIGDWFELVRNVKAKYGIQDEDTYNFDETGFMMGVIGTELVVTGTERRNRPKTVQPGNREWVTVIQGINALGWAIPPFIIFKGLQHLSAWYEGDDIPLDWTITLSDNGWTTDELGFEWIKHFDKHMKGKTKGSRRLLILDGHGSHDTAEFHEFCREHNIITLCIPAHSSHLLQPLDVGCFAPLKKAYGKQVEELMRNHINHITKLEFLPAFRAAFDASMTSPNIRGGFRGSGLIPFNPEAVISNLDVKLRTPTPFSDHEGPWSAKTPGNQAEMTSQTELIKSKITRHQDSSPTPITNAVDQFLKGAHRIAAQLQLYKEEVAILRKANEAMSKRKRRAKRQIQRRGTLTKDEGSRLIDQTEVDRQIQ
jgi:DDE superfamily endonuclease